MYEIKIFYCEIGGGCSRMPDAQPHAPENLRIGLVNSKASDFPARLIQLHKDTLLQNRLRLELRIRIDFPAYSPSLVHQKLMERGGRGIDADFQSR